jgi:hypothetical protein
LTIAASTIVAIALAFIPRLRRFGIVVSGARIETTVIPWVVFGVVAMAIGVGMTTRVVSVVVVPIAITVVISVVIVVRRTSVWATVVSIAVIVAPVLHFF